MALLKLKLLAQEIVLNWDGSFAIRAAIVSVFVLSALILGLYACLILSIFQSRFEKKRFSRIAKKVDSFILDLIIGKAWRSVPGLVKASLAEKKVLRDRLVEHMKQLEGAERQHLQTVYREMGFEEAEKEYLTSKRWWIRLEAVLRLDIAADQTVIKWAFGLVRDPHPLVAGAALRVFAKHANPEECFRVLIQLKQLGISRSDIVLDILNSMARRVPDVLLRYFQASPAGFVAQHCVRIFGLVPIPDAAPLIAGVLYGQGPLSSGFKAECLTTLGKIGNVKHDVDILPFLEDKDPKVRSKALDALIRLNSPLIDGSISQLNQDGTIEVARVIQNFRTRKRSHG